MEITKLTWPNLLSAFRVPTGLQYFSSVAGGFFMITNAIVYCLETFAVYHDGEKEKQLRKGADEA